MRGVARIETRFTRLVGCTVPIQLAGMGSLARPPLAVAVAKAGGLGMIGWVGASPETIARAFREIHRQTAGPVGMNFIIDGWRDAATGTADPDLLAGVREAASHARVVEFFYADPDASLVDMAHEGGALACWQAGSVTEAVAAERAGCDLVVAQGTEAGGHVRGKVSLAKLLPPVVEKVRAPVVAAGGTGTGRAMAKALAAGASAVRVGTRFVAAEESEAHPRYMERLIEAEAKDTVLTEGFSTNWPNAPHRVLRASLAAMRRTRDDVIGERENAWDPSVRVPVHRGDAIAVMRSTTGNIDAMPHWAGTSVDAVTRVQSAAEIVRELVTEAETFSGSPRRRGAASGGPRHRRP